MATALEKPAKEWWAYAGYGLVSLAVMAPLLTPGFILTLDLVFAPTIPLPEHVTSSYPFHALLHFLNFIVPSEVIEKTLLFGILLLSSIGMHRLIRLWSPPQPIDWGLYVASIFFAVNPFTYSRFMAGQYAVLLGYALLPWLVQLAVKFATEPRIGSALKLGGMVALIGIVSLHTLLAVAILGFIGIAIGVWQQRWQRRYLQCTALAVGCFVLLSSFWLIPLALDQGQTANTIASFTAADTKAFATTGENGGERLLHVLQLQGFWAEGRNLYFLPQDWMPAWGLVALAIVGLVLLGFLHWWQKRRQLVLWFGLSALIGLWLAIGGLGSWAQHIPLLQGLREPHKMTMLVALCYGVFLATGINLLLRWLYKKSTALYVLAATAIILLPFLYTRVMFWGFGGQLVPRQYPADWSQAKASLEQAGPAGDILFLPWHQYMIFGFAGRIIATPAPTFYGERIVASRDPELKGASGGPQTERHRIITDLLQKGADNSDLARQFAAQNIRFILLAKERNYRAYDFLSQQPGFLVRADYPSIMVYENQLWGKSP